MGSTKTMILGQLEAALEVSSSSRENVGNREDNTWYADKIDACYDGGSNFRLTRFLNDGASLIQDRRNFRYSWKTNVL